MHSVTYYVELSFAEKALNHLLSIPDDDPENSDALNMAVDVIGSAADQKLTAHLMSFLLGDVDGSPKVDR